MKSFSGGTEAILVPQLPARSTVRKYVNMAIEAGLSQESPLPPDHELAALLVQGGWLQPKPHPALGRKS